MKNLVINGALLLFAFTICSFQTPNPTVQEIFQEALNIEALVIHLAKDADGDLLPLTMTTDGLLSEDIQLSLNGKVISVVNNAIDTPTASAPNLQLKEMKLKGKKSYLLFQYGEKSIKIRLKNDGGDWVAKTINVKWKNNISFQTVSTSETHF